MPIPTAARLAATAMKHDLNTYLTRRPDAPVHTLADIIAFNNANPVAGLIFPQ